MQEVGPDRSLAVVADVTSAQDNRRMVAETVERFGALDVFVAVAGVNRRKRIVDVEPEDYEYVLGTNLKGVYLGCQAACGP